MRFAAQAKMGYYPTPEDVTPIIAKYLKRKREGLIRILDPCAGMGTAVKYIGEGLNAETYGIEVDLNRGNQAKEVLTRCLVTDYQNTRISHGAFSLLWLNPPYDWAARNSDIEKSERYERTFLRDCISYLRPQGGSGLSHPSKAIGRPDCENALLPLRGNQRLSLPGRSLQGLPATGHLRRVERKTRKG